MTAEERNLEVVRLRDAGLSLKQVAERLGISTKERVRQIEHKTRRKPIKWSIERDENGFPTKMVWIP